MTRVLHLRMNEGQVVARCLAEKVGISAIEGLPQGGVRLVCMSSVGAETIRQKLRSRVIQGEVRRERHRPITPMW